jgi:uncharacterized membrane protein
VKARLGAYVESLGDQFWLRPGLLVVLGAALGELAVRAEDPTRTGLGPSFADWVYAGGEAGARSLLGAVASSTIAVAGTTFSITIAALSLASGQMGPRLLRNFIRDAGNQAALGIFLGTFAYALVVLRTVRGSGEDAFVPHLGVTGALVLALLCVGTLVWFVHHIATGINVETVIDVVHRDLLRALDRLSSDEAEPASELKSEIQGRRVLAAPKSGYLQSIDTATLAGWAAGASCRITLRVRPGDYVSEGSPVADVAPEVDGAEAALAAALVVGPKQAAGQDLEFAARQLVEVAVRALSPGINDPFTAAAVLDHLGDALCRVASLTLPTGVHSREGRVVLVHPSTDYVGLCDTMFHTIRQNAAGVPFVVIRLVEVLTRAAEVERTASRLQALRRHADLALAAARREISDEAGQADLERRYAAFLDALPAS